MYEAPSEVGRTVARVLEGLPQRSAVLGRRVLGERRWAWPTGVARRYPDPPYGRDMRATVEEERAILPVGWPAGQAS